MDLYARLTELKDDPTFGVLFVAPTGVRVVDAPPAFADFAGAMKTPEFPLDLAHAKHHAEVATAFASAISVGYATAQVCSAESGELCLVEFYDEVQSHGCFVVVLSGALDDFEPSGSVVRVDSPPERRGTMRLDAAGRFLSVDRGYETIFGFTAAEICGSPGGERVHPEDSARNTHNWAKALRNPGVPQRFRQRTARSDGSWMWGDWTMTSLLNLDDPHMLVEVIDIDNEMRMQAAAERRQALLLRIADALPVGVVQLADGDAVELSNRRWSELTGQPSLLARDESSAESVPRLERVFDAFRNADEVEQACRAVADTGDDLTVRVLIADDASACTHGDLQIRALIDESLETTLLLTLTDVSEAVALQARLQFEARNDHLTSILNRQGVEERIDALLATAGESDQHLAMLYLDLDGFKLVNDRCGHRRGDEVLQQLAIRLSDLVREGDQIGRLGGDEFVVIAPVDSPSEAQAMQRRIQSRLRIEVQPSSGEAILVTASVGVAIAQKRDTFHSLTNRADAAMYRFKDRRSTDT